MREFMQGNDWEWQDLGCLAHTALRKRCDSSATSVMYNLVQVGSLEWELYLRCLANLVRPHQDTLTAEGIIRTMKQMSDNGPVEIARWSMVGAEDRERRDAYDAARKMFAQGSEEYGAKPRMSLLSAMLCTTDMFDDNDWLGFVSYWYPE